MKRICLFLLLISTHISFVYANTNPVTYHLSFDNLGNIQDMLTDDWIQQTGLKTVEDRKWLFVDGRYGSALYLGAVPLKYDVDNMSGLDLDMVTAVIFNVAYARSKGRGYDEPFIWGAGKLHPAFGAVSFWVKGSSEPEDKDARTILFEQTTTTWGRLERQLIEIELFRDRTISAYVEDARYFQHTITTGPVWDNRGWNHIVFMWDRSSGISLWVNGAEAVSSMGTDAWWENQRPGLFHFPMSLAAYDEFYTFNRTLTGDEIAALYKENSPPEKTTENIVITDEGAQRLKKAYIDKSSRLPIARKATGDKTLVFTEITPERIHDEGISGWWIADGRYELAWPHEYSVFTVIPGDVDFHAEKADLLPPAGSNVNYITLEGNLDDISVIKGDRSGKFQSKPQFSTGKTSSFFYGALTGGFGDAEIRVPFTKSYGAPPGFETDNDALQLPLSGDLRLHEIGLFNVKEKQFPQLPGDKVLYINAKPPAFSDKRYPAALKSLFSIRDNVTISLSPATDKTRSSMTLSPMGTVNLITGSAVGKAAYDTIILDMFITTPVDNAVLGIRLFNPAVPSQTWTHAETILDGFSDGEPRRLRIALSFDPVFLVGGDRICLQLVAVDGMSIKLDHELFGATVTLRPVIDWAAAEPAYAMKTLRPCIMGYGRSFEYIPWLWDKHMPDIDTPENFGGQFDMAYPWQAVLKVNPGNKIANIYKAYTDVIDTKLQPRQNVAYPNGRAPLDMKNLPDKQFSAPRNAPDWAVYFREFQTYRNRIVTWWRAHQRSDGQAGGGWNDDTLIFSRAFGDMPLDSNPDALALYNNVFDGFDKTNYFKDGYCRIFPIDRLHNGDFVRERYKSLIYNLGDPRSAVWAMEEAWHWEKPDKTPINYGNGRAFLFGKDVLEWYWGKTSYRGPYKLTNRPGIVEELRKAAIVNNDITLWRSTEAWCHTDDQSQYGANQLNNVLLGGWGFSPRKEDSNITITVGVGWPEGGGPDTARLVEYSGNDGLRVSMYSFSDHEKEIVARLYRMENGVYTITISADKDGNGSYETVLSDDNKQIRRFDKLAFALPPQVPVYLDINRVNRAPVPGDLPDLAVSDYYVERKGSRVNVTVHNIGCAPSGPFTVSLVAEDGSVVRTVDVDSIAGSEDFVPKKTEIKINKVPKRGTFSIVVDRDNDIEEIFEENNIVKL